MNPAKLLPALVLPVMALPVLALPVLALFASPAAGAAGAAVRKPAMAKPGPGAAPGDAPAAAPTTAPARPVPLASAAMVHADGTPAGMARIVTAGGHAMIVVELTGIAAGTHGLHLHMTGTCDGPAFTTAGGHLNPTAKQHGMDNPAGSHLGDLPNVTADAQGKVSAVIHYAGDPQALAAALFDADGSALVLHAGPDDYKTDPSGNSGGRIACGVLSKV